MGYRIASLFVVALWLCSACQEKVKEYEGYIYDGPVNSCSDDGDCPEGSCDPDINRCVLTPPTDGRTYQVRVIPQSNVGTESGTGVPSQVFEVALDNHGNATLPLEVQSTVTINPLVKTLAGEGPLQGRVILIDVGNRLPGRAARIVVYEASGSAFDFNILPSTYDIIVIPEGDQADSFPVTYLTGVYFDEQGWLRNFFGEKIDLIVPEAGTEVRGVVRQGGLEMNGLTVVAVDPVTGRIKSTEAVTACTEGPDDTCGWFSIKLAEGVEEFSVEVSRPAEPHHPVFTLEGFTKPELDVAVDLTGDPRLDLDALGVPVSYIAEVEKKVQLLSGVFVDDPAPGCFVLFQSDDVAGGSVSRWVSTNESGAIEESEGVLGVNLYPGDYNVTVIPPEAPAEAEVDYTAFISPEPISISGSEVIGGQVFTLPFRPLFKGSVLAWGEQVPQATLIAQPHLGEADFPRSSSASTGFDGLFSLWLDPGTYRVVAEAPPESGFAWGTRLLEVEGNGSTDLGLPLPYLARATVTPANDQVEVGGAVVEWYFTDTDGRAYAIGRVAADADGNVTALLPL
jgi:hypothetical protein